MRVSRLSAALHGIVRGKVASIHIDRAMPGLAVVFLVPSLAFAAGYRSDPYSDGEIDEIRAAVAGVYPGALTTISGATSGCACEEGPLCTSQSQVNVAFNGKNMPLSLSRIEGRWDVGRLQRWQLKWAAWGGCMYPSGMSKEKALQELRACRVAQHKLWLEKPVCADENRKLKAGVVSPLPAQK